MRAVETMETRRDLESGSDTIFSAKVRYRNQIPDVAW